MLARLVSGCQCVGERSDQSVEAAIDVGRESEAAGLLKGNEAVQRRSHGPDRIDCIVAVELVALENVEGTAMTAALAAACSVSSSGGAGTVASYRRFKLPRPTAWP